MKRTMKNIAFLLIVAVLLSMPAYAAERDPVMPCENNVLSQYACDLLVSSGNKLQVHFSVTAIEILDKIGALQIEIQRSSDGENWTTVKTYKYADYPSLMATGTAAYSSYVTYYGEYGYYYRAKVSFYGQEGLLLYGKTRYTNTVYLSN